MLKHNMKTYYLASNVYNYWLPAYHDAVNYLHSLEDLSDKIILSRDSFRSTSHFLETYKYVLAPVTDLYILTTDEFYISLGCWREYKFLKERGARLNLLTETSVYKIHAIKRCNPGLDIFMDNKARFASMTSGNYVGEWREAPNEKTG